MKPNVGVLVYGDIGRSPRMQNHAVQLSKQFHVYLIGYKQNAPFTQVSSNPDIQIVDISSPFINKLKTIKIFYLYALLRIIIQTLQLFTLLVFTLKNLKFVLVQNPPSIPVLSTVWLASKLKKFKFLVDFHNYGYTILKMGVKNKIIGALAEKYQKFFGKRCQYSFCVSDNMRQNLDKEWGIKSIPLYDRPTNKKLESFTPKTMLEKVGVNKGQKDIVIVSSTSWTKDEDFSILLNALEEYESSSTQSSPYLHVLITGKGPQKQFYQKIIAAKSAVWKKFCVKTLWLEVDDYPKLLASCDLGVCLHYSSSGLDLPMKVVDMFNAGLPVLAIDFATIRELVKDGVSGFVFQDSSELCSKLKMLGDDRKALDKLKENAKHEKEHSWGREWQEKFGPVAKHFLV